MPASMAEIVFHFLGVKELVQAILQSASQHLRASQKAKTIELCFFFSWRSYIRKSFKREWTFRNVQCWNHHDGVKEKETKYEKTETPRKSANGQKAILTKWKAGLSVRMQKPKANYLRRTDLTHQRTAKNPIEWSTQMFMPSLELYQTMEAFTRRNHSQVARKHDIRQITSIGRTIATYNLFLQRRDEMKKGLCCILCFNKIISSYNIDDDADD